MKPDDAMRVAQGVVFEFEAYVQAGEFTNPDGTEARDRLASLIARAIMAATKAEREAILQFEFDLPVHRHGADMMIAIREYIRQREEATNAS